MEAIYERCCGIDIHKKMIVACLIVQSPAGQRRKETRTFRTMTHDLLGLLDWLKAADCTHVAMESTGVYWKPVYNLLEGQFELLVVNAQHIKAVPGHKTDVKDAEWIADLLQHGLLKASFIPAASQRELRELTRYRVNLGEERARTVNRFQKTLEDTNIKLGDVATDIMGKSAREMVEAMLAGQRDPVVLAKLARGRMKAKRAELEEALVGTLKAHHCFLLSEHLVLIDTLDEAIERVNREIDARLQDSEPASSTPRLPEQERSSEQGPDEEKPRAGVQAEQRGEEVADAQDDGGPLKWEQAVTLLCSIPGIGQEAAQGILAEIGVDMSRFPTAGHLASWAGMCPGNHESAGKRLSGKTRKGSPWLRRLLVQAAHAAGRTKNTYLSALSGRLKAQGKGMKAVIAVGHRILVICYQLLKQRVTYQELGGSYFEERDRQRAEKRLVQRLEKLGYQVSLQPTVELV